MRLQTWDLVSESPEQTECLGEVLGGLLRPGSVLLLAGDLGSGKTCLTRGLARGAGVAEDEPVTSPSYTLMNHYRGRCELFHFDLYRLGRPEDLDDIGFDDAMAAGGIVVIEWAQRFAGLPASGLRVEMGWQDEQRRRIRFVAQQEVDIVLLEKLQQEWTTSKERG